MVSVMHRREPRSRRVRVTPSGGSHRTSAHHPPARPARACGPCACRARHAPAARSSRCSAAAWRSAARPTSAAEIQARGTARDRGAIHRTERGARSARASHEHVVGWSPGLLQETSLVTPGPERRPPHGSLAPHTGRIPVPRHPPINGARDARCASATIHLKHHTTKARVAMSATNITAIAIASAVAPAMITGPP